MKNWVFGLFLSTVCLSFAWGDFSQKMFQVGSFSSFKEGGYEGHYSIDELSKEGNFGIGAFEGLNGEMIAYKGHFYSIGPKGQVKKVKNSFKVPFAQVVEYSPKYSFNVKNLRNFRILGEAIADQMENKGLPCAILIKGKFSYLKLRGLKEPKKASVELVEAIQEQGIYHFEEMEGYAIGFWAPAYWGAIMPEGYHFNFVDEHFSRGGRVLDMHLESGEIFIQPLQKIEVYLPEKV